VYWDTNCPITTEGTRKDFELCIIEIEKNIIPDFRDNVEAYAHYRFKDFMDNFGAYTILREVEF
jgi:hypothetical protein